MAEQPNENAQEVKDEEVKNAENISAQEEVKKEAKEEKENVEQEEVKEEAKPEVDAKDAKIAELEDQLLRLRAEFANYKRRTTEDTIKLGTYTTVQVVKEFLKVLDNFERAEAEVLNLKTEESDNEILKAVVEGMQKIRKQFDETLKKLDVEEIKAEKEKFNPNLHEAVMRGENPELPEDTIDQVFEKGYKIREQVVRTSKVRVISK